MSIGFHFLFVENLRVEYDKLVTNKRVDMKTPKEYEYKFMMIYIKFMFQMGVALISFFAIICLLFLGGD